MSGRRDFKSTPTVRSLLGKKLHQPPQRNPNRKNLANNRAAHFTRSIGFRTLRLLQNRDCTGQL